MSLDRRKYSLENAREWPELQTVQTQFLARTMRCVNSGKFLGLSGPACNRFPICKQG